MKQLVIIADDKVGLLADISFLLSKSKMNIDAISAELVGNKAVIHLTVKDEKKAKETLEANDYKVVTSDVLVIKLKDEPGELSKISKKLAEGGVNIAHVHLLTKGKEGALFSIKVDKNKKAQKILEPYLTIDDQLA